MLKKDRKKATIQQYNRSLEENFRHNKKKTTNK